ncbi:MAG TPA: BamA/TamA family outer membrane protein [Bryobacterales bacterium]|nr:BamA/TamA family outer membrane protein [Bryobacterales bacterium]
MKYFCLLLVFSGAVLPAWGQPATELNVNSRYTIESIEITGVSKYKLSKALAEEVHRLTGQKFDPEAVRELARKLRNELHARAVSQKLARGDQPEQLKVTLEVKPQERRFDVALPKAMYYSRGGWTGDVEGKVRLDSASSVTVGVLSDSDALLERYAGITARYENTKLESDRVRLRFTFEGYHQQWNASTLEALDRAGEAAGASGIYRARYNLEPVVSVVLARPLTLSAGVSFGFVETQFPASRTQAANAVVGGLRYHDQLEDSAGRKHTVEAGYRLRAASKSLASDFGYTRQRWDLGYEIGWSKQAVAASFAAGVLTGRAPLYERFVLGNSETLRGWSKFDVAPLGGDRMAHTSLEYRYEDFAVFYDVGADWMRGGAALARHSVGVGLRDPNFFAFLAFPIKTRRAEPIFMVGTNF